MARGGEELGLPVRECPAVQVAGAVRVGRASLPRGGIDQGGLGLSGGDLVQVNEHRALRGQIDEDPVAAGRAHGRVERLLAGDACGENTLVWRELPPWQRSQDLSHLAHVTGTGRVEGLVPPLLHAPHLVLAVGEKAAGHCGPPSLPAHDHRRDGVDEARRGLSGHFGFYNTDRPHQALGYRTPAEVHFEAHVQKEVLAEA